MARPNDEATDLHGELATPTDVATEIVDPLNEIDESHPNLCSQISLKEVFNDIDMQPCQSSKKETTDILELKTKWLKLLEKADKYRLIYSAIAKERVSANKIQLLRDHELLENVHDSEELSPMIEYPQINRKLTEECGNLIEREEDDYPSSSDLRNLCHEVDIKNLAKFRTARNVKEFIGRTSCTQSTMSVEIPGTVLQKTKTASTVLRNNTGMAMNSTKSIGTAMQLQNQSTPKTLKEAEELILVTLERVNQDKDAMRRMMGLQLQHLLETVCQITRTAEEFMEATETPEGVLLVTNMAEKISEGTEAPGIVFQGPQAVSEAMMVAKTTNLALQVTEMAREFTNAFDETSETNMYSIEPTRACIGWSRQSWLNWSCELEESKVSRGLVEDLQKLCLYGTVKKTAKNKKIRKSQQRLLNGILNPNRHELAQSFQEDIRKLTLSGTIEATVEESEDLGCGQNKPLHSLKPFTAHDVSQKLVQDLQMLCLQGTVRNSDRTTRSNIRRAQKQLLNGLSNPNKYEVSQSLVDDLRMQNRLESLGNIRDTSCDHCITRD